MNKIVTACVVVIALCAVMVTAVIAGPKIGPKIQDIADPDGRVCRNIKREIDALGPNDDAQAQALIILLRENDCIPSGESRGP